MVEKYGNEFLIKDIFPYTYINSFDHYNHTTFPDIKYFDDVIIYIHTKNNIRKYTIYIRKI